MDHEVEDSIYSEFFNDMFSFRMSNRRWFPMVVRAPGTKGQGIMGQTLVVKRSGTSWWQGFWASLWGVDGFEYSLGKRIWGGSLLG